MKKTFFILSLILLLNGSVQVLAQDSAQNQSTIVSPARFEKEIRPGDTADFSLKVTNNKPVEKTFFVSISRFNASEDESGRPTFNDTDTSTHSAYSWFKISQSSVTIPAGQRKEVPILVEVPANAESGGYYNAIILSEQNPAVRQEGPTVGVTQEIGTLVLIKVPGLIREEGRVLEVFPAHKIFFTSAAKIYTRFENTGNIHIKPTGLIEIYNMFGQKEEVIQINSPFSNVLPGTIRRFESDWTPPKLLYVLPSFGRYKVDALVTYGLPAIVQKVPVFYFWVIPVKFLAVVVFSLLVVFTLLYLFLKLYTHHVISRYHRR